MALPDFTVAKIEDLEGYYNGIFLKARATLGVTAFGLSIVNIPEKSVHYPEHNHPSGQEEVLVQVGDEGLQAVAIGGTRGEAYTPAGYTELGAIDPLDKRPGT